MFVKLNLGPTLSGLQIYVLQYIKLFRTYVQEAAIGHHSSKTTSSIINDCYNTSRGAGKFDSPKHNGNITLDDIINAARIMKPRSMAKEFSGVMKEVLGTAQSIGCTIDGMTPHAVIDGINEGTIDVPSE